ncbi:MAG TPA: DUF2147 domain-containing protein [Polyangiales bacterium]|nr:DUF2147 domain-containing protein [Polyangiales bacterium]
MFAANSGRSLVFLLSAALVALVAVAGSHGQARHKPGDEILGEWWTEGNQGRILMKRASDGTFLGKTTCCVPVKPSEDHPAQDVHNPNPKQRSRSTVGIILIWKLTYEGDGEYADGYVYNPRDGKTYRIDMEVVDRNTVKIRGYIGIPLLGQTQTWKRFNPAR